MKHNHKRNIIILLVCVSMILTGCQITTRSNQPFTIPDINLKSQNIPYDAFKSNELYDNYLKPLFLELGFNEEGAVFNGSVLSSSRYDTLNPYRTFTGKFEIPNSRYYIFFEYSIRWLDKVDDYVLTDSLDVVDSGYRLSFYFNSGGKRFDVFDEHKGFTTENVINNTGSIYGMYNYLSNIFQYERTTLEIYDKLKEIFNDPDIKEKLLIEKQAQNSGDDYKTEKNKSTTSYYNQTTYTSDYKPTPTTTLRNETTTESSICNYRMIVTASMLNIRSYASTDAEILGKAPNNAKVNVIDDSLGDWYKIEYDGVIGYVSSEYLTGGEHEIQETTTSSKFTAFWTVQLYMDTEVKERPSVDSPTIGMLEKDSYVDVDVVSDYDADDWYKIEFNNGIGYISENKCIPA